MKSFEDDIELISRLKKGDVEAFDLIYDKYSGKIYAFGLKHLKSPPETMELVQSVFLKVWENRNILKKEASFKSYLFTIAYNDICKFFRKRSYHQKFKNEFVTENNQYSFETEAEIDCKSLEERIWQIVEKLPERQKNIFKKSRLEGKTTKEIATELDLAPGTIDNYISKSIKFIQRHLHKLDLATLLLISLHFI